MPSHPKSSAVVADTDATAVQYNNLRLDAIEPRFTSFTAGENLTALDPVYQSTADANIYRAIRGGTSNQLRVLGFAMATVSSGAEVIVCTSGYLDGFSHSFSAGNHVYLGATAGTLTTGYAGSTKGAPRLGYAISGSAMIVDIEATSLQESIMSLAADDVRGSFGHSALSVSTKLNANETWVVDGWLRIGAAAADDFRYYISGPTNSTLRHSYVSTPNGTPSSGAVTGTGNTGTINLSTSGGTGDILQLHTVFEMDSAYSGTYNLQFGTLSGSGNATIYAGSTLHFKRVA